MEKSEGRAPALWGQIKLLFQCLSAVGVFLVFGLIFLLISPILILNIAQISLRVALSLRRKWRGAVE